MTKKITKSTLSLLLSLVLLTLSCLLLTPGAKASEKSEDIIILYENDAHCNIDGYSKLSALKKDFSESHSHVGVVSSGDFIQGDTLGAVSQGKYIVETMNMVGYDAIALGNHEFDYMLERLMTLSSVMTTKPVCSNFLKIGEEETVFEPYRIVSYGDKKVAFIGITTPDTLTSSTPIQFMDEEGNYIYTFSGQNLADTVQKSIDSAKKEGADYIVGLAHLGSENVFPQWSIQTLISGTEGFDAVLDGHSHSVVESMVVEDKATNPVLVSSTGTKFQYIGKLTISDEGIRTELIETSSLKNTDPEIDSYITEIKDEVATAGNRVVGYSDYPLIDSLENGDRLIRNTETNLGDFCADAYRVVTGADIGVVNGGGIRAGIKKGEITVNHLLSVHPYNNTVCVAEVTGQQILDFLELSVCMYPDENGSFQHVSGLTYTLNAFIPSSVEFDENMAFKAVLGERRVSDVRVLSKESGKYEPLDPKKTYTLASHNYLLINHGSGATMFNDAKIILDNGMLDLELLEVYLRDHLGGVVPSSYESSQMRVTVLQEKPQLPETTPETTPEASPDSKDESLTSPETGSALYPLPLCLLGFIVLFALLVRKCRKEA